MRTTGWASGVYDPPVAEAKSWVAGRTFDVDRPLIDLSQAVPAYPPATELRARLAELVRRDDMAAYAPAIGLPDTRAGVAGHLGVETDHVMITAGCNQAFCLAIGALCQPGDNVILPVPYYFNHDMWLAANGVEARYESATRPATIDEHTRAIVLVTPNNPTGAIASPDEIAAAFERAAAHDIALILDETYKDFRPTNEPAHHLFGRSDWDRTLIQLFSFSKVFALAGYRAGSLVAHPDLIRDAVKLADCQTIGAPRLTQHIVAWALENLVDWVEARRIEMNAKIDAFAATIELSTYQLVSSGAYFAWLRHPFEATARDVARSLADDANLLCIPGECFGPNQQGFLRLAFGNAHIDQIPEIVHRLSP
jgi:aspartate/methionine/tyrosine aminotransferase